MKEDLISLKREIKQTKIDKNRRLDGFGECSKLKSDEEGGDMCILSVLCELTGEMNNLKNKVTNLKDEIMKMKLKTAKDRELG